MTRLSRSPAAASGWLASSFKSPPETIAWPRVNRPAARNALTWSAQEGFAQAVAAARAADARALIITGAGQAFVSGGDLKELANHPEAAAGERLNRVMSAALDDLVALPCPVIAAVNGDAIGGGCEILTACDLRLAAPGARFAFRQVHNGLTTGWGGAGRLVALIGQSRATELLLTGRTFDAAEAQALGLVHRLARAGNNERPRVGRPRRSHGLGKPFLGAPGQGIARRRAVDAQQGDAVGIDAELDAATHGRNDTRNRAVARFGRRMARR